MLRRYSRKEVISLDAIISAREHAAPLETGALIRRGMGGCVSLDAVHNILYIISGMQVDGPSC